MTRYFLGLGSAIRLVRKTHNLGFVVYTTVEIRRKKNADKEFIQTDLKECDIEVVVIVNRGHPTYVQAEKAKEENR